MPAEGDAPVVMQMCEWLGVSKSGFYDWRTRPQSESAQRRELLEIKIKALFEANNSEYGYRRIHAALVRGGESVDDETVRKIMRDLGLEPCQPRPWRFSLTEQDGQAGPIPDLVNRDFTASEPGEKIVGDITYIDTWEGSVYLATVIDYATRKIVGWAMDDNYKTPLISSAIEMAARNLDLPEGAIFHSDRGTGLLPVTGTAGDTGDAGPGAGDDDPGSALPPGTDGDPDGDRASSAFVSDGWAAGGFRGRPGLRFAGGSAVLARSAANWRASSTVHGFSRLTSSNRSS